MTTINIYYHYGLIIPLTAWVLFLIIKSVIETIT